MTVVVVVNEEVVSFAFLGSLSSSRLPMHPHRATVPGIEELGAGSVGSLYTVFPGWHLAAFVSSAHAPILPIWFDKVETFP